MARKTDTFFYLSQPRTATTTATATATGSDPGAKRQLNVYCNYDVVKAGDLVTIKDRDDREFFAQWTVQ